MKGLGNGLEAGMPGLMQDVSSVVDHVKSCLDMGENSIDFSASGVGRSSAAIINSAASGGSGAPVSLTVNLMTGDGLKLASWLLPDLIRTAGANGTPIVNPRYA